MLQTRALRSVIIVKSLKLQTKCQDNLMLFGSLFLISGYDNLEVYSVLSASLQSLIRKKELNFLIKIFLFRFRT